MTRALASLDGIGMTVALLVAQGGMCNRCGHGTRATSKRWARCRSCDQRVRRRTIDEAESFIRESLAATAMEEAGEP